MRNLSYVPHMNSLKDRCYHGRLALMALGIIGALMVTSFSLYFASSHSTFIFGLNSPFSHTEKVESFQSVSAHEPLLLAEDVTIFIEDISYSSNYIQVTTRIDNQSGRDQQFSSTQFELNRLSSSSSYNREFISSFLDWKYSIGAKSSLRFSNYFAAAAEDGIFSLNISTADAEIIGQFLLTSSDIDEF